MEGMMNAIQAAAAAVGIFGVVLAVIVIVGFWKVFSKAGEPGWSSIIPIYSFIVLLKIIDKPIWWIILMFIPLVNFIIAIICCLELAKKFGKGAGFGIGLVFLSFIFVPILGFGKAEYQGHSN